MTKLANIKCNSCKKGKLVNYKKSSNFKFNKNENHNFGINIIDIKNEKDEYIDIDTMMNGMDDSDILYKCNDCKSLHVICFNCNQNELCKLIKFDMIDIYVDDSISFSRNSTNKIVNISNLENSEDDTDFNVNDLDIYCVDMYDNRILDLLVNIPEYTNNKDKIKYYNPTGCEGGYVIYFKCMKCNIEYHLCDK